MFFSYMKNLFLLLPTLVILACTNQSPTHSSVTLQFDSSYFKNSASNADQNPEWGLVDPITLSEIGCWAIFVGGPEDSLKTSSCRNSSNEVVAQFGPRAGFYKMSESGTINIPVGTKRQFWLVGMKTADGTCETDFNIDPDLDFSRYSSPFILGKAVKDLINPEETVRIQLVDSFEDKNKLVSCDFMSSPAVNPEPSPTPSPDPLPVLTVDLGSAYNFSNTVIGSTATQQFILTNTGNATAQNIAHSFSQGTVFTASMPCTDLAPSESCNFNVSFTPAVSASVFDALNFSYQFGSGPTTDQISLSLSGNGLTPASLTFGESSPYNFGTLPIPSELTREITIYNAGESPASLSGPTLTNNTDFDFEGGTYPGTGGTCDIFINPFSNCTVRIKFAPQSSIFLTTDFILNYEDGTGFVQPLIFTFEGTGSP